MRLTVVVVVVVTTLFLVRCSDTVVCEESCELISSVSELLRLDVSSDSTTARPCRRSKDGHF